MPPFRAAASVLLLSLLGAVAMPTPAADRLTYPETRRDDTTDQWHGRAVPDPYRWLEQDPRTAPEVSGWIEAQNKVTFAWLGQVPQRQAILARLEKLYDYERYKPPIKVAGRYYYEHNSGLQNQSVLYGLDSLDGKPKVIIDPNTWAADGTAALISTSFSDDGRWLAYARSVAGSDWQEWFIRDLMTGKDLPDRLQWTKFTGAEWSSDNLGFFYSRFPEPEAGAKFQSLNINNKLYYHRVGTPQSEDVLVYHRPEHPDWGYFARVSEDGQWLVIHVWKGTDPKYRLIYKDLSDPKSQPVELITEFKNEYSFLGNDDAVFYLKTDLDAPRGRVIAVDTRNPDPAAWRTIIPQGEEPISGIAVIGDQFVISSLKDAVERVRVARLDGTGLRDVTLPGVGSVMGFQGKRSDKETFYSFASFNTPTSIHRYDLVTGESRPWREPKLAFKPADFTVTQVFYKSKDGTRIPMFLAHRKDVTPDGNRPTLLYGYGGFSVSMTPVFSADRLAWMEMGGVFALPNLRGGGEYGEEWHRAGTGTQKQNVFDDFIAAAEWLIAQKWTKPSRLAIQGGSNGGLLVGACMIQRPDLFGAALPSVGVMDMLRYHKFTAGRYWVDDYGSADDPKLFPALLAYSPCHNLKPGTKYPPTLVTTADTDDRVIPAHSFKFAAALQHAQAGDAPVLIRIETAAGHGAGKPTRKAMEESADEWAFLVRTLRMEGAMHAGL